MEKINGELKFDYDASADVLYSFIDRPRPAKTIDMDNGILLRMDIKTKKIVGFTVMFYKKRKNSGNLKKIPCFEDAVLPAF